MKRFCALLLAASMCLSLFCSSAMAVETEGPACETIVGGYDISDQARASADPSAFYNLSGDNNYYTAELIDLAASKGSYTRYYFATGTEHIYVKCDLMRSGTTTNLDRELKIHLYEKASATAVGTLIVTRTVNFSEAEVTARKIFYGLDAHKFYYIRFVNNSSTSSSSSYDISGTILIDDIYN